VVAAPSREAIEVGEALLARGGNAIDAAVGAAFAQFVVEPFMTGPGAVGELVYLEPSGEPHVVDAAARAPLRADPTMFDVVGEPAGIYSWPEVAGGANTVGP
jgi:gamma-glutamyltranspeptidase/glutathione hydrolase